MSHVVARGPVGWGEGRVPCGAGRTGALDAVGPGIFEGPVGDRELGLLVGILDGHVGLRVGGRVGCVGARVEGRVVGTRLGGRVGEVGERVGGRVGEVGERVGVRVGAVGRRVGGRVGAEGRGEGEKEGDGAAIGAAGEFPSVGSRVLGSGVGEGN